MAVEDLQEAVLSKAEEMTVYKVTGVLQSHDQYLRLMTAIEHAGLELYYKAFRETENGTSIPTEPDKLYKHFLTLQEDFNGMKKRGELDEKELAILLPDSKETYTQEFGFELFQKIMKYFYTKNDVEKNEKNATFLSVMEELKTIHDDKNLIEKFQKSDASVEESWTELAAIFQKLEYEAGKVDVLKTVDLDENKKFRYALIRSEINILLHECDDCLKTVRTNLMALDRLKGNFETALLECKENNNNQKQKAESDLEELHVLREDVVKNQNKITLQKDELNSMIPNVKFWRQQNIEGDIIVCDEKVSHLRNVINEQTNRVGELFNTVSFDICRIKERTSSINGDMRVISPPLSDHGK